MGEGVVKMQNKLYYLAIFSIDIYPSNVCKMWTDLSNPHVYVALG